MCAPNAFKGSISAAGAARCLAAGVADAGWAALQVPVADGGDGTLDVLLAAAGEAARTQAVRVSGPLGRLRTARLGWVGGHVAVVEMAEAAGLRLLVPTPRTAVEATSRGVGELIGAAVDGGARRVIVGVGGSASTDGGAGLLAALGAVLLDGAGRPVPAGGAALHRVATVDIGPAEERVRGRLIDVAVDVRSPLLGPDGAARVFGPQKGAGPPEVAVLEGALGRFAELVERACGRPGLASVAGAGAAGGAAFALAALGARLVPGASLICDEVGLDRQLEGAALALTGEGRLDAQTLTGKGPAEVAARAGVAGVPCVAVCGSVVAASELFSAAVALDSLDDEPRRRVRALLRLAAATVVRSTAPTAPQP